MKRSGVFSTPNHLEIEQTTRRRCAIFVLSQFAISHQVSVAINCSVACLFSPIFVFFSWLQVVFYLSSSQSNADLILWLWRYVYTCEEPDNTTKHFRIPPWPSCVHIIVNWVLIIALWVHIQIVNGFIFRHISKWKYEGDRNTGRTLDSALTFITLSWFVHKLVLVQREFTPFFIQISSFLPI